MELKDYQQTNLDALDRYLTCLDRCRNTASAFTEFWRSNNPPLMPAVDTIVEPYKDNVKGAPHVCHKVPTGGGKTFIASAAIRVAMDHVKPQYKMVVWLVPSNAILEQTLRHLRNKQHPYRQRIDTDFQNRVEVFDKQQALTGHGFTLTTVRENLCILVMSFDSLRTNKKEGRKAYQENGYLQSFAPLLTAQAGVDDEVQLMKVLQAVHPVVIVDESHNATSRLSEQMLNDLRPSLVIDLTATPRTNSNIICFTDALKLKSNNMVKLPVIVYNHARKEQVIDSALHLQRRLEQEAQADPSGNYIRPIVLFQAESKQQGTDDRDTYERVKQSLKSLGIPEEQIKIKTADMDELKGVDLMSKDCPVRFIITVNALKEGWDCPFAYILASLADRSSSVDVEQIVGRVLRLPYARRNQSEVLNLSYVLTASAKFQETLDKVVKGLNHAGFSGHDYRAVNSQEDERPQPGTQTSLFSTFILSEPEPEDSYGNGINTGEITFNPQAEDQGSAADTVTDILNNARKGAEEMENNIKQNERENGGSTVPVEIAPMVKTATIQSAFRESAAQVVLPRFFVRNEAAQGSLFGREEYVELKGEHLLKNFRLSDQDAQISFMAAEMNAYLVDINTHADEHTPAYQKLNENQYDYLISYIQDASTLEERKLRCASVVAREMGRMIPLSEKDVKDYVARVLARLTEMETEDFLRHLNEYTKAIKSKIINLEDLHKEREFDNRLNQDKIFVRPDYRLPDRISLKEPAPSIVKMLHTREDSVNGFEVQIINDVANLANVEWWTRNVEKRGFCINGFINHYPDFIIKTRNGKVVLLETKGDHLEAEQKIKLGQLWASKAGNDYRYCLVYNEREVTGAYTKDRFIETLKAW